MRQQEQLIKEAFQVLDTLATFHRHSPIWAQFKVNDLIERLKNAIPPEYDDHCPACGREMTAITYPIGSPLNEEQWMSCRKGDYYCTDCPAANGFPYAYYWNKDLKLKNP